MYVCLSGCAEEVSPASSPEGIGHWLRFPTNSGRQSSPVRKQKPASGVFAFLTSSFTTWYRAVDIVTQLTLSLWNPSLLNQMNPCTE
jgi:hypothetical protein